MTTYYLDYVNGADANNGSSWALAKKTIDGYTAAILNPGDIIRMAKSPDPTSIGSCTWNNLSKTVTLGSACTLNIDMCEAGWVQGANVTATADASCKEGSYSLKLVTGAGVVGAQLLAYKTIASTNFSSCQQISFWFNNAAALLAGVLEVRLCSDTLGVTAVDTFAIPANAVTSTYWCPLVINKGSNLGAAIQSIAIYCTAAYASKTIYFDDFIACHAVASADSLNLTSLISKNTTTSEGWYPIQSISGSTILIDNGTATVASAGKGYYGATGAATTYKRETIKTTISITTCFTVQDSGAAGNLIQWEGGYNTASSSVDGETFFDGQTGSAVGIELVGKIYNKFNNISCVRFTTGLYIRTTSPNCTVNNYNGVACNTGLYFFSSSGSMTVSGYCNCNNNVSQGLAFYTSVSGGTVSASTNFNNNIATGASTAGLLVGNGSTGITFASAVNANNCGTGVTLLFTTTNMVFSSDINANYCTVSGIVLNTGSGHTFNGNLYSDYSVTPFDFTSTGTMTFAGNLRATGSTGSGLILNGSACHDNIFNGTIAVGSSFMINNTAYNHTFNGAITITSSASYGIYFETSVTNVVFNGAITITGVVANHGIYMNSGVSKIVFNEDVTINGVGGTGFYANGTVRNIRFNKSLNISNIAGSCGVLWGNDTSCIDCHINNLVINTVTGGYGVYATSPGLIINRGSSTGTATTAFYTAYQKIYASNYAITGATYATGMAQYSEAAVYLSNCAAAPLVNKTYVYGGLIQSDSGTRHTASGIAWRLSPTHADRSIYYPVKLPIARIAVNANSNVTVTAWMRRDNAAITGKLFIEGGQIAGVDNDLSDTMTVTNDWEQRSITFLPTAQGVVEVSILAYGGTTYNVWVDDFGVTQ